MNTAAVTYTRYELLRTFRNRRFFIFSLGFPIVLFLVIGAPNRGQKLDGIPFVLYYMTGMAAFGSMSAVMAGGARIAMEREAGWNRQLRITPLTTRAYFRAKVFTGYVMALISIGILCLLGLAFGVHLAFGSWFAMIGLILVGLIPFSIFGIMMGHLLTPDSMGPAMGGVTALFALLGGAWGPLASHGAMHTIIEALPSYWLVQAGKTALSHQGWPAEAWIVIGVWSLVLARLAVWAFRHDTARA
jgi:ABC-2 type transport system permease protein